MVELFSFWFLERSLHYSRRQVWMSGSSLDVWVRNILVRSSSLPEDITVHPKRVSSAIRSLGFPILGVVSVLILAYSLVPRIQWTGSSLLNSTSSIFTPLRWSYLAKMSLYQGLVRVSNTPRSPLLYLCSSENFPRGFQSPRLDFYFSVCCLHERFDPSELFPHWLFTYSTK